MTFGKIDVAARNNFSISVVTHRFRARACERERANICPQTVSLDDTTRERAVISQRGERWVAIPPLTQCASVATEGSTADIFETKLTIPVKT